MLLKWLWLCAVLVSPRADSVDRKAGFKEWESNVRDFKKHRCSDPRPVVVEWFELKPLDALRLTPTAIIPRQAILFTCERCGTCEGLDKYCQWKNRENVTLVFHVTFPNGTEHFVHAVGKNETKCHCAQRVNHIK